MLNLNLKTCLQIAINFYEKLKRQKKKKKGTSERERERASERERKQKKFLKVDLFLYKIIIIKKNPAQMANPLVFPRAEQRGRGPEGRGASPGSAGAQGAALPTVPPRGARRGPTPRALHPPRPLFLLKGTDCNPGRHPPPPTSDPHKGPALAEPQATDGGPGAGRRPRPAPSSRICNARRGTPRVRALPS